MEKKGLILIPFLTGYGGTETVIKNLLNEYNKKKNQYNINLKLYSLGGFINGDWLKFPNVKVFQFPKERYIREFLYLFLLPFLILYSIIKEEPNFIISTNPIIWTIAKICSLLLRKDIKIIAWYHYSYTLKPINRYCLHKPDYFFVISKSGKKELFNLGINKDKIFIVYNPIEPTNHVIKPSKNHNQFIYVGRLQYKGAKNINELFRALALIRNFNWKLRIYGAGTGKEKLIKLSRKLHIDNNIKWMGFIEDPLDNIKHADALLLTSTNEGFSMVIAEALSHGLYVISSNCPVGPHELITSYNGKLYEPGHIKQLASFIKNILNNRVQTNERQIKSSISKYYVNNYLHNFIRCINCIEGSL